MKEEKIALFDFDGTLSRGDSVVPYLMYCIRKKIAPKRQLFRAVRAFLRQKTHPGTVAMAKETTLSFIKGKTVEEMDAAARGFFREVEEKRLFGGGREEILRLKREGVRVVVISASAEVWMRVLPEFLPVDEVIATPCLAENGRYTGKIPFNCRGEEKVRAAEKFKSCGIVAAYGDSGGDIPMLRLAEKPVTVNPKPALRKAFPDAEKRKWS